MPLIQVIVILILIGLLLWLANNLLPMEASIKKILNAVVVVVVILWLLSLFFPGVLTWGPRVGPGPR